MTELLDKIETFLAKEEMPPTAFGTLVLGDPGFVFGLRAGRTPRKYTADWVENWLNKAAEGTRLPAADRLSLRRPRRARKRE